jgi:hypothetical protein
MRYVFVTIVDSKSNHGENCQRLIPFDNINQLISTIDSIIDELGYRRCEVTVEPEDFLFEDEEIEELEDDDIFVRQT